MALIPATRVGTDGQLLEESRRHPRISFSTEVWLGQDGIFTRGEERFSNVSVGGAFIELEHGYPIGSIVNLRFSLPIQSHFITCAAIVRSAHPGQGIGIEFLDLSPEYQDKLQAFVEHRRR